MTTSAHGSADPWGAEAWPAEADPQDIGIDDPEVMTPEAAGDAWDVADYQEDGDWGPDEASPGESASWSRLSHSSADGLPARALILTTVLATGACAVLDLGLTAGRMTFFFDLCFVVICLVAAMAVRREDLFTAGVLPPLVFASVIAVVAVAAPQAFESSPGISRVFLSGLASHAAGLVGGYAIALLAVAARMAGSDDRVR